MDLMETLSGTQALQAAASMLFAGYAIEQIRERLAVTDMELHVLSELLDARLIIPQPSIKFRPDGHIDVLAEVESVIPIYRGQLHVAVLASTVGGGKMSMDISKLIKDYVGLLRDLQGMYVQYGIKPVPDEGDGDEGAPTLGALLDSGNSTADS